MLHSRFNNNYQPHDEVLNQRRTLRHFLPTKEKDKYIKHDNSKKNSFGNYVGLTISYTTHNDNFQC